MREDGWKNAVENSLFHGDYQNNQAFCKKKKNDSHIHGDKMTYSELIEGKVPSHDDSWENVFSFEKS